MYRSVDKTSGAAYDFLVDFSQCTTAIVIPSLAVQIRTLEQRSSCLRTRLFAKSWSIVELSFIDPEPCGPTQDSYPSLPVKDYKGILLETRVHHHLELGVERFLHREFTYPSRSTEARELTPSTGASQSHRS